MQRIATTTRYLALATICLSACGSGDGVDGVVVDFDGQLRVITEPLLVMVDDGENPLLFEPGETVANDSNIRVSDVTTDVTLAMAFESQPQGVQINIETFREIAPSRLEVTRMVRSLPFQSSGSVSPSFGDQEGGLDINVSRPDGGQFDSSDQFSFGRLDSQSKISSEFNPGRISVRYRGDLGSPIDIIVRTEDFDGTPRLGFAESVQLRADDFAMVDVVVDQTASRDVTFTAQNEAGYEDPRSFRAQIVMASSNHLRPILSTDNQRETTEQLPVTTTTFALPGKFQDLVVMRAIARIGEFYHPNDFAEIDPARAFGSVTRNLDSAEDQVTVDFHDPVSVTSPALGVHTAPVAVESLDGLDLESSGDGRFCLAQTTFVRFYETADDSTGLGGLRWTIYSPVQGSTTEIPVPRVTETVADLLGTTIPRGIYRVEHTLVKIEGLETYRECLDAIRQSGTERTISMVQGFLVWQP